MEVLGPEAGAEAGADRHPPPREEAGSQEEAAQDQLRPRLAAEAGPAETPTQAPGPHPIPSSNTGHPPPPSQDHLPLHLLGETETASEEAALSIPGSQLTRPTPTAPSSTQATTRPE